MKSGDAIFAATCLSLMGLAMINTLWRFVRRRRLWRQKREESLERLHRDGMICIRCGYNVRANPLKCSECGYEPHAGK